MRRVRDSVTEPGQVESFEQAGFAGVGCSQLGQALPVGGGAAVAFGEVPQVDEELDDGWSTI